MISSERYRQDGNLWMPADLDFQYSDGDEAENYILEVIRECNDLSTGSPQLFAKIKDWPSLYHLSAKRADLLRPLQGLLINKKILEIGSGCGAITRFLGELNCDVLALEGSRRRALITSERCRGLANVTVVADNFDDFQATGKFDCITLIGVLEYSNFFIRGDHPPLAMLQRIKQLLSDNGHIIIAIENKLGLKYLAGAPEDHTGKPYTGIENMYGSDTAITFGKKELQQLLQSAGFDQSAFLYPFPDYKLPHSIITENGFKKKGFDVPGLLLEKHEYIQDRLYDPAFNVSLAAREAYKNGFASDVANSFLVVAGHDVLNRIDPALLAVSYSTSRQKAYCKSVAFSATDNDVAIEKKRLYEEPLPSGKIKLVMDQEAYKPGDLLQEKLLRIVARKNWTLQQVVQWAGLYYQVLKERAKHINGSYYLDGRYLDLTPFNIIEEASGAFFTFDQEWDGGEPLPVEYIFFRGVYYSLGQVVFFNAPSNGVPTQLLALSMQVTQECLGSPLPVEDCRVREKNYFSAVWLQQYEPFDERPLLVRQAQQPPAYALGDGRMLTSLPAITCQLFWSAGDSGFDEARSLVRRIEMTTEPASHTLPIAQSISSVKKIRIDFANQPGAFYLHDVTINDKDGKVIFDWPSIRRNCVTHNTMLWQSHVIAGAFLFIATTDDPILELEPGSMDHAEWPGGEFNIVISVSMQGNETIAKELRLLTQNELDISAADPGGSARVVALHERIDELERKIAGWQTEKEELIRELNAKDVVITSQQDEVSAKGALINGLQSRVNELEQRSLIRFIKRKFMNLKNTTKE